MNNKLQNQTDEEHDKYSAEEFKKIYDQLNYENQTKVDRMIYEEYVENLKSENEKT